jgi:molecular chaperone GrpE
MKNKEKENLESVEDALNNAEPVSAEAAEAAEKPAEPTELERLQQENAELKEKLIYLQADYQNYRKRTAKDISDARSIGQAAALEPFLTINDFLDMAKNASEKSDNIESIRQGLDMIIAQFVRTLDEIGVKKLHAVGEPFNPELHEAVAHEHSDSVKEGIVIKAWNAGYKLGDKLLRPARVIVSAGPEPVEAPAEEAAAETAGEEA